MSTTRLAETCLHCRHLGVGKDSWLVQVYGENLTDTQAELYANYTQYYKAVTVSRPRTIGLRYTYKFSGH